MSELERQISWVTRGEPAARWSSAAPTTRSCSIRCPPSASSSCSTARAARCCGCRAPTITVDSNADFSRDLRFTETVARGVSFSPAFFERQPAVHVDLGGAFRLQRRRHRGRDRSQLPLRLSRRRPGRQGGVRLCGRSARPGAGDLLDAGPMSARTCRSCRRSRPSIAPDGEPLAIGHRRQRPCGADGVEHRAEARLDRVLRAADRAGADADPRPAGAHRAFDRARPHRRDHRRHGAGAAHADPDHGAARPARDGSAPAISASASRSTPRTSWKSSPTSSTAWPASSARPMPTSKPRSRSAPATSRSPINELKVLEEVGRAVASSLDLNAVLPTVAARALEITHADAVLIYGYDRRDAPLQPGRGQRHRQIGRRQHRHDRRGRRPSWARPRAAASRSRLPISTAAAEHPLRDVAVEAGFHSVLVVPLVDQQGVLGSLVVLRRAGRRVPRKPDRPDAHLCAPGGAGDAQRAAVHRGRPQGPRARGGATTSCSEQADKLQEQTEQLRNWNRSLEERVETQLGEIERIRKLERFLAPQVAQLIASSDGHDALLDSHRREVTVVFCDLRGFTVVHRDRPSRKRR